MGIMALRLLINKMPSVLSKMYKPCGHNQMMQLVRGVGCKLTHTYDPVVIIARNTTMLTNMPEA